MEVKLDAAEVHRLREVRPRAGRSDLPADAEGEQDGSDSEGSNKGNSDSDTDDSDKSRRTANVWYQTSGAPAGASKIDRSVLSPLSLWLRAECQKADANSCSF